MSIHYPAGSRETILKIESGCGGSCGREDPVTEKAKPSMRFGEQMANIEDPPHAEIHKGSTHGVTRRWLIQWRGNTRKVAGEVERGGDTERKALLASPRWKRCIRWRQGGRKLTY